MATQQEDCASILEHFIHESANLPAEITHMLEEISEIDKDVQRYLTNISIKDSNIQKHIKNHGSLTPHPKEQEYADYAKKHYDMAIDLQKKKIAHSDKACILLDRQLKRLDTKIRQLVVEGQMEHDASLPSIFNRKSNDPKTPAEPSASRLPLEAASVSALNITAHRLNSEQTPVIRAPQPRQLAQVANSTPSLSQPPRASALATSTPTNAQPIQNQRDSSAQPDPKRRKLAMSTTGINLPSQPSSLRQSSIGPTTLERVGTPKAGTPTGSRAGSIPRALGSATNTVGTKRSGLTKKVPHQQVTKLKGTHKKHARLSQSGRQRKGGSPSVRGARASTAASSDSALSSADPSDSETASVTATNTGRGRRSKGVGTKKEPGSDAEGEEDDQEEADDRNYCVCEQPSYGEMVGCENDKCDRQWFHIGCLGLKTTPTEEHWFCPECRVKPEIIGQQLEREGKKGRKRH